MSYSASRRDLGNREFFGERSHSIGDFGTELRTEIFVIGCGVYWKVVQKGSCEGHAVVNLEDMPECLGHPHGIRHVSGMSVPAAQALMGAGRKRGPRYQSA